jgi:hypothetical protein
MPAKKKPREHRLCKCGCGESFYVISSNPKQYAPTCPTVNNPSVNLREDVIRKIRDSKIGKNNPNWKPRQIRLCECGCGESFSCIPASKRRFMSVSHSKRGNNNPMKNKETAMRVASYPRKPKSSTGITNIANAARKRMLNPLENPIHVEENATKLVRSRWPDMTEIESEFMSILKDKYPIVFVGNGGLWIGGKCPDFIIAGTNIVIETTRKGSRTNENYTEPHKEHFSKYGYECIVVWSGYRSPFFTSQSMNDFEQELHQYLTTHQPEPIHA